MVLRSLGKVVRGKSTPAQLMAAAILGSLIGFTPADSGAGLIVALAVVLLVVNASLPLALLTWPVAKLASWVLLPLSFHAGRALLDGPLSGLFRAAVNAPVVALFGLETYVVTGGLLVGTLFGIGLGLAVLAAVGVIRRRMAKAETDSPAYRKLAGRWWVALLAWALIGGRRGKLSWSDVAARRGGNPVRIPGVILAAVVVVALIGLQSVLAGPLMTAALRSGLERVNGATVDVGTTGLDLAAGRLFVTGLAVTDPEALDRDVLRAARLDADVSTTDLLRKRLRLDQVVLSEASSGAVRATPGRRVGPAPPPPGVVGPGERTLEDYLRTAQEWQERLTQVRRLLERLSGDGAEEGVDPAAPADESLAERLERRAREFGYGSVTATHLIEGAPTFAITELLAEGLTVAALPGEVLDLRARHLSTHPRREAGAPEVNLTSRSGRFDLGLALGGAAVSGQANALRFRLSGLDVDRIASDISVGGKSPLSGGTLDLELDGGWSGGRVGHVDLPLLVTLHDSTLHIGGSSRAVSGFRLPLGLRGPIDAPAITIDDDALVSALKAAGAAELSRRVDEQKQEALEKVKDAAGDKAREALGGLFGGKKKD